MAYISHSGTDNTSQYDWKILIFMILLLVSILVFVAIKFLFPGVVAGTNSVFPDQAKNSASAAAPMNKTEVVPQIIPPKRLAEKKTDIIAPASKTTAVNDPENSAMQPVHEVQAEINSEQKADTETLLCSKNDRASGLCQ